MFYTEKIVTLEAAAKICEAKRICSVKVGYTSGVFDILHSGHVQYLAEARKKVDFLVVGINSDNSVRKNKGDLRPIQSEDERAQVVAGLAFVDCVFVFDELNNNKNIELIKPNIYIKAGDYSLDRLSSAPLVAAYGGKSELIPVHRDSSTSKIIDRIVERYAGISGGDRNLSSPGPAVFLDRDGTLIDHVEFIHEPEKVRLISGVGSALKRLSDAGFKLVVVTNQPGIGLGYFTREDFFRVNRSMLMQFKDSKFKFDKIYFCPHSEAEKCNCRKPQVGMIERAAKELGVDLSRSFVVGDMRADIELALNCGCRSVLVQTGVGMIADTSIKPTVIVPSVVEAVNWILENCQATAGLL